MPPQKLLMQIKKNGNSEITAQQLSNLIVEGMTEKKAQDIVVLDLREVTNAIADFFIICSASSDKQVEAITESIEATVYRKSHQNPYLKEGKRNHEWVLIDYTDCVAHVFQRGRRQYYNIEQLWGDALFAYYDENGQKLTERPTNHSIVAPVAQMGKFQA